MKTAAQIFKALGDETRLRIVALLMTGEELCVCDIVAALELPQSTVSRHLACLRNVGLVDDRRQGVWMYYKVNKEGLSHVTSLFNLLTAMLSELEETVEDQHRLQGHLILKDKVLCK